MRKRAQIKSKPRNVEPQHTALKKAPKYEEKSKKTLSKNWWITLILVGIFFLVLFYNTYYNASSELAIDENSEGFARYLLSGPDPYYNMRHVQGTYETGVYQYYTEQDDLLNYPLGAKGGRAPLLNMMALGFSNFLTPFMSEIDAIGYSMQFIPALFGALLVIPVYFLTKNLFNKKAGLIAAFFIAVIPIHIGSGHGSAYSLFDHDSLNLLLFFLTFLFIVLSLKERDRTRSILYAVLAGIPLAGLSMVWVEAQFLYVLIAGYAIVQYIVDIFTNKIELTSFRATSITLLTGYVVSLPVMISRFGKFPFDVPFFMVVGVIGFGLLYYLFGNKKIPWTLSLPSIFMAGASALALLYFVSTSSTGIPFLSRLSKLGDIIFGAGIYGKKVSMTIAEANTYQISHTVMSFGPALYWLGWAGFIFLLWHYYKDRLRRDYLFIIVIFALDLWLAGTAGRFLNDMVPLIAILSGWIVWFIVDKIDYKQMIRTIRSAGGGFHGIRRGVKLLNVFGILFLAIIVVLPNAYVAMDAAVPAKTYEKDDGNWTNLKWEMFGEDHSGAFGLSLYKESYWSNALNWLNQQDKNISDPSDRPAFISWWDYGFYEVAIGGHPTVADNFQDGIPPASNFHTATSEKDAVAIWIIRLLEGNKRDNSGLSSEVKQILKRHLGENNSENLVSWIEDPTMSPSYNTYIDEEFNEYITNEEINEKVLVVGSQWHENAVYHDFVDMVNNGDFGENKTGLTDDEVTWLYHDIQDATGYSIRYYGVEGYDKQIFNIFAFLSDKSLVMLGAPEDEFVEMRYSGTEYTASGSIKRTITNEPLKDYLDLSDEEKRYIQVESTPTAYKSPYFDTMFYKTYVGPYDIDQETGAKKEYKWQLPCLQMKHFYAEFISDMSKYQYYNTGKAAVVIAKYYEGALLNGSVRFNGSKVDTNLVVLKNLTYYEGAEQPIEHDSFNYISSGENATEEFSVIAGAGSYLQLRKNVGQNVFVLKNITFNGDENSEYAPITDDVAMRQTGSNYERYLNITIQPGTLTGVLYNDEDDNGVYNESFDSTVENINVKAKEIKAVENNQISEWGEETIVKTDENGLYSLSGLEPGIYRLRVYNDEGYTIHMNDVFVYEGENTYDVVNPKQGSIEGTVYFDQNQDGNYTSGEEEDEVELELKYYVYSDEGSLEEIIDVDTFTTQASGNYVFDDLIPGDYYVFEAKKGTSYETIKQISIEANTTKQYNLSLDLTAVSVTGQTLYNDEGVEGITVKFEKDESIGTNTAESTEATSDDTGNYEVELKPGTYNVSATKMEDSTLVYEMTGEKLVLTIGQEEETGNNYDIVKKSVTLSGTTSSNGANIENVTTTFTPTDSDENNTGIPAETTSDLSGDYELEIAPGDYTVYAESEEFIENDESYVYQWTGSLSLSESDISLGKTFNIDELEKQIKTV